MKVKLYFEDILSLEEEEVADNIKNYIDFILGVKPCSSYYESEKIEE